VHDPCATSLAIADAPSDSDDASDRPTLVPDFDPEEFARDSEVRERASFRLLDEPTTLEARRLLRAREPEQALHLLEGLLELAPFHAEANAVSRECRAALEREWLAALGSGSAVLAVRVTPDELKRFALDHVSGFLLSLMDGSTDLETLLDLSGLPRLLALRNLRGLVARGIVEVEQVVRSRRSGRVSSEGAAKEAT
jgi:hypothetical protein